MGLHICIFRVRCQREAIATLLNVMRELKSGTAVSATVGSMLSYQFYVYAGSDHGATKWGELLEAAFGDKSTTDHTEWKKTTRDCFVNAGRKRIIFELVIHQNDDLSAVQYLLLMLHEVFRSNILCTVLVSGGKNSSKRYTPLSIEDYFRLSHQLFFYAPFADTSRGLPPVYNCFFVCLNDYEWKRLPRKYSREQRFGRIIPQIPITHQSYRALLSSYNMPAVDSWSIFLHQLCEGYHDRLKIFFIEHATVIHTYMESDSCFETLLFLSLCCYISENAHRKKFEKQDVEAIHETCMNFSQGIMQLVENVVVHVLGDDEKGGCGILTIRFRLADYARSHYLADSQMFQNVDYFLELYLTDLQYGGFSGIVEKFQSNVEARRSACWKEPDRRKVHSKFFFSQNPTDAVNLIEKEEPESLQEEIKKYIQDTNCSRVSLADFFGAGKCKPFQDYISAAENMAFHYGLPILNSVISSLQGYLYVQSGEQTTFSNAATEGIYTTSQRFQWNYGTAFTVYIPLKLYRHIGEVDYLVPLKHDIHQLYQLVEFHPQPLGKNQNKEELVRQLRDQIKKEFRERTHEQKQIGVIKCDNTVKALNAERLDAYEILAKAVFLYLADDEAVLDHLALINITGKYDVIKLFRLFALFFDRTGQNMLLKNEKSLFLVDCTGTVDILFYGNNLKSIRDSLSISRLYGGTTEDVTRIIQYLLEGRHE